MGADRRSRHFDSFGPRFTKDLDFAIAVTDDSEAEDVVNRLRGRGYQPVEVLEQEYVKRLSGVRLERSESDVIVDLLFASSGIENEESYSKVIDVVTENCLITNLQYSACPHKNGLSR